MSADIHMDHHVTALLYHLVFPAKCSRAVFDEDVDKALKDVCMGIEQRYEVKFLQIGHNE